MMLGLISSFISFIYVVMLKKAFANITRKNELFDEMIENSITKISTTNPVKNKIVDNLKLNSSVSFDSKNTYV